MAKQVGPYFIKGCIDNICFYEVGGQYYARMKSSLDGKRVKKDPAFKGLMRYAGMLGQASKLASVINREIGGRGAKSQFKLLKTKAYRMLREGIAAEDILYVLRLEFGIVKEEPELLTDVPVTIVWDVDRLLNDLLIWRFDDLKMESIDSVIPP